MTSPVLSMVQHKYPTISPNLQNSKFRIESFLSLGLGFVWDSGFVIWNLLFEIEDYLLNR